MATIKIKRLKDKINQRMISSSLNGRFKANKALVLTSSPRSGSTLLSQILTAIPRSCVLFEPLHLDQVPEAAAAGFTWRTYVDPNLEWPQGKKFLNQVFEGRIVNSWISREITLKDALFAEQLIVKFVRANRLLPWLCNSFEIPPPIFLIRHPCAVIASQIKYGWANAQYAPESPPYLDSYPLFHAALSQLGSDVEYLAAAWALDQLPVLLHKKPHPWLIITYEELFLRPEKTIRKICEQLDLEIDIEQAVDKLNIPSSVVSRTGISGLSGWKRQLTSEQIDKILRTVNTFGIEFYDSQDEGDYDILGQENICDKIKQAGGLI